MLSWTWNNTLTFTYSDLSIEIGFTSNGQHFDRLSSQKIDGVRYFGYCNGATCISVYESTAENSIWINSSFKNITFDTLPNEQLMSILSANATVNKNISKVEINGATLIDISNDTVVANILAQGYTAHDKTGKPIAGTLTQQSGKTVTPGTSNIVAVESGKYTTGTVYVKGDSNLTADNIKSGTSIFGVTGSYAGSSPNLQSKSVTYTSNGTATVTPDSGYDGLSSVDVTVDVVADVPLVTVMFKATQYGDEINSPGGGAFDEMKRIVISAFVNGNISMNDMYNFSNQWGGMVFPFDVAVPQGSSVTICDNSAFGGGVSATNALVDMCDSAEGIKSVYTIYNITDGATITIDVS